MKRFLIRLFTYIVSVAGLIFAIGMFAGPYTDPFYRRFTTPRQSSLIVGTSRAAQGLVPEVINQAIDSSTGIAPLYNYSFTIKSSPFGRPYLNSILKKLQPDSKARSVFIVAVDPWSISSLLLDSLDNEIRFREEAFAPNNMTLVEHDPNPEYLFKNLDNRVTMLSRFFRHEGHPAVMDDGSLAVKALRSNEELTKILPQKLATYKEYAEVLKFSPLRFKYFEQTIDTLSQIGTCIIVRLPVHNEMVRLEQNYMADFDSLVSTVAARHDVLYLNYIGDSHKYSTTDGNHLTRESALVLSREIGEKLKASLSLIATSSGTASR